MLFRSYDSASPHHPAARDWLVRVFSSPEPAYLAWDTVLAFLRIGTNSRALRDPFSIEEAVGIVAEWLARPNIRVIAPGERHWDVLREALSAGQCRGPLVSDANLAALALEHGLVLCTVDRDFSRFPSLRTENPLETAA